VVSAELYDRLTWTRRLWPGWRFARTYRVENTEELRRAYDEAWLGDTILVRDGTKVITPAHFTRQPRGDGVLVIARDGTKDDALAALCRFNRQRVDAGARKANTVVYGLTFVSPPPPSLRAIPSFDSWNYI
jgi:hypothetical protein